jgi:hypothetical protein
LTEILRKKIEELQNNITTDMDEGRKMLTELSGKIKVHQYSNQMFYYS